MIQMSQTATVSIVQTDRQRRAGRVFKSPHCYSRKPGFLLFIIYSPSPLLVETLTIKAIPRMIASAIANMVAFTLFRSDSSGPRIVEMAATFRLKNMRAKVFRFWVCLLGGGGDLGWSSITLEL